jgi:hypothetical protein
MNKKNKKGQLGQAVTWLHKFFILILVIGGVVGIVMAYYSHQIDVRDVEADIIARNLIECMAPEGDIIIFNKEVIEDCLAFDKNEIFINISLGDDFVALGDDFLEILCKADTKAKQYPACLEQNYYVTQNGQEEKLTIFMAIRKFEKNI